MVALSDRHGILGLVLGLCLSVCHLAVRVAELRAKRGGAEVVVPKEVAADRVPLVSVKDLWNGSVQAHVSVAARIRRRGRRSVRRQGRRS